MPVSALSQSQIEVLRRQPFTYPDVGSTARGQSPADFIHFTLTRLVNHTDFELASADLLSWQVQQRAGLKVAASSARVVPGAVVVTRMGVGRLAVQAPCRVVYVNDGDDVCGFAYGTLPGHPESGEESFVLTRRPDGRIEFTVSAFSRPATLVSRLGGPLTSRVQASMTRRYLRALDH